MPYRESSILTSLVITLVIWGSYTLGIINLFEQQLLTTGNIYDLLFTAVIYTIFLEVVLQTSVTISKHKEANDKSDERDKLIAMRANYYAYKILTFVFFCVSFYILFPVIAPHTFAMHDLAKEYEILHLMVAFGLVAEVVCLLVKLISYRRGY